MADVALTAHQIARLGDITADLSWIGRSWPDLYQLRVPGNRRRPTPRLSAQALAEAGELARAERADRDPESLGASPAPVDVGVLDQLSDLLIEVHDLAERLAGTAGAVAPEAPSSAYDYPSVPRLCAAASANLAQAAEVDPECLDDAAEAAGRLRRRLEEVLDDVLDGQRLTAVCAWCRGTTPETPVGGERTMVVRLVGGQPVIVCEGPLCDPPSHECGTWIGGKPAWPQHAWSWLSQRLHAA